MNTVVINRLSAQVNALTSRLESFEQIIRDIQDIASAATPGPRGAAAGLGGKVKKEREVKKETQGRWESVIARPGRTAWKT